MRVFTTEGEIERALLETKDECLETDDARLISTEWRYRGRIVRRDVWVNPLRLSKIGVENGE